jgi:hypothetical protein
MEAGERGGSQEKLLCSLYECCQNSPCIPLPLQEAVFTYSFVIHKD